MHTSRARIVAAGILAVALLAGACSKDDSSSSSGDSEGSGRTLNVPKDYATIQKAVDASKAGDLILVAKGTYHEAVDVTKDEEKKSDPHDITIRGVDRNEVILDGQFKLENGIRVLDAEGIVVENMTARNYLSNGFYWTGSKRYRGSYLTAYRNGDYGIYAFDSYDGQFDHSYGSGSPDAGFYIGECYKCNAVISEVKAEYNGLGYSGTNSGGDLYIVNSEFDNNRVGIVPNSGSYELCYPSRDTTIAGNIVHDNNYMEGPGIEVSLMAQGNGILPAGAVTGTIQNNLVYNHDRTGIGLVPFPEADANDVPPPPEQWSEPCSQHHTKPTGVPQDQCKAVPLIGEGCVVMWDPQKNTVKDNDVSGSKVADLAVGTVDLTGSGVSTESLGNCFSGNQASTTAPAQLQELAPCNGEPTATDWEAGKLDLVTLLGDMPPAPPKDVWRTTPEPPAQKNMPDASTAPAPIFKAPMKIDLSKITTPSKPAG